MGKPGRSGKRCYPYPVTVGDTVPFKHSREKLMTVCVTHSTAELKC